MNNRLIIAFLAVAVAVNTTACSTTMLSGDEFRLSGSKEGIAAFGDVLTGTQIIAKTEAKSLPSNPHSALRRVQEEQATIRIKLMSPSSAQGE